MNDAPSAARTVFEFGRIQTESDWIAPILVLLAVWVFVVWMYRRDTIELGAVRSTILVLLRAAAFAGLFVIYLQPQWRNERDIVTRSRVVLLADTSLSMDTDDGDASPAGPTRAQQVGAALADQEVIEKLRATHDVIVARFDRELEHLATLDYIPPVGVPQPKPTDSAALPAEEVAEPLDWAKALAAQGTETRLGEALRQLVSEERGAPLAGIVVFTDGQQNAGLGAEEAAAMAVEADVSLFPVGLGADRPATNVRVADFVAPPRAVPGDSYSVTGFLQAQAMDGKAVHVELLSRPDTGDSSDKASERIEASEDVTLAAGGELTPVKFQIKPKELGRRMLTFRVQPPPDDRNRQDNQRETVVEIVDRKTRVLLFAGAASREYQFLRNMLRRDKEISVDVLLQTGTRGVSQDANAVLEAFPATRAELFEYDCIVAFDPDWRQLDAPRIDALEEWVGEQAGGLIVIAGPVNTDLWSQSPAMSKIRALYPVEFNRRFAVVEDGRFGSKEAWPLKFERAGLEAEFLWLDDAATASAAAWDTFPGVYGYYDVRGPKPDVATVFARFSDPGAGSDQGPPYFVSQFFGAGRVFYLGSGELWRLRAVNEGYFETFYTKLIRHVSQGRLLRGSNRGVLSVDRERYLPGGTVDVRASVRDVQLRPLEAPQVQLQVIGPDGAVQSVKLSAEPEHVGSFRGQFTVRKEGSYRLELPLPDSNDERLTAPPIQVTIPDLERDDTRRNDALLASLAQRTRGQYFVGLAAALSPAAEPPLVKSLRDASRTTTISAAPDRLWDNTWMLAFVCGVLCLEWIIRRLSKLA